MDMHELLSIASLIDDEHVSRVYARGSLCYAKWGDTSDYGELFDLVMSVPLPGPSYLQANAVATDIVENWWKKQYVTEIQKRWECRDPTKYSRLLTVSRWRLDSDISVWTCLEGERPPTTWSRKPTLASLQKEARQSWSRADLKKSTDLYYKWTHACTDPYYCRMHGFGSD